MKEIFASSAKFYDLIYKDKDYAGEAQYVFDKIKGFRPKCESLLELGCGTGNYSYPFRNLGLKVHGIDASSEMISIANQKTSSMGTNNISFEVSSAENLYSSTRWDSVISLFFMLGYQISDESLQETLKHVRSVLGKDGLFVFDFWNAPCVLKTGCSSKKIVVENEELWVSRESTPKRVDGKNCIRIKQSYSAEEKGSGNTYSFDEMHEVRFFFREDIVQLLEENNFELLHVESFMNDKPLDDTIWAGIAFAKAK